METVKIDSGSATSLSLEQAIYRLAPLLEVVLLPRNSNSDAFVCELTSRRDEDSLQDLVLEFRQHVNDYFLREKLAVQTEGVRTLLYAKAFAKAAEQK